MLKWLPVESLILERQSGYYAAINTSNNAGNSTAFIEFMLTAIRDAMRPYLATEPATRHDDDAQRLLALVTDQPRITIGRIVQELGMPQRSVERLIASLKASGRLTRIGSPRAGHWQAR